MVTRTIILISLFAATTFGSIIPQQAYLKTSGRTPSEEGTYKDDIEFRIGASRLDLYNIYWLCERENYFNVDSKEWYIGYGGIVDLVKSSKLNIQFETFDRHRYESNSQSLRVFYNKKIKHIKLDYGFSMLGKYYENFQPALFFGLNSKIFTGKIELDANGRVVSSEKFSPTIPLSKTTGIQINIEHIKVDKDFYNASATLYYKEQ